MPSPRTRPVLSKIRSFLTRLSTSLRARPPGDSTQNASQLNRAPESLDRLVPAHRVDSRICPNIDIQAPLDEQIADPVHVLHIQDEHLIGNFYVPHSMPLHEELELISNDLRTPESITVDALLQAQHRFSTLERGLDAAETAVVGAPKRCVQ